MSCPDEQILLALCRGELDGARLESATEHVADCAECRAAVAAASGASAPARSIGRFAITEVAGRGAMGVVYRGRDERLDREVALKVIRASALGDDSRARLDREARSLARIDHPNVVRVYEVGESDDGELYLAMELVRGGTLASWLAGGHRPASEILARFVAAGRGLAAAHAAGLVHRDFKPANVLIDPGGVAKVADFGLAGDSSGGTDGAIDPTAVALTQTGMVLGTPAYMAPEQLREGVATARSDQFSFCVALFEALAGHRPFAGDDVDGLRRSLEAGQPLEPRRPIRREVHRALRRGLAVRPADRFESIDALLAALGGRGRSGWLVAAIAGVVGVALLAAVALAAGGGEGPCADADQRWQAAWNDDREAAIRAAIEDAASVRPKLARVKASLELDGVRRFGDDWRSRYRATCRDGGSPNSHEAKLRRGCLVDVLGRLEARVLEPNPTGFDRSIHEVREQLERCATHLLSALARPADEVFDDVERARSELARSAAARLVDDYERADRAATAAIEIAGRTGYAPLAAEAWLERALIARSQGRTDRAIDANRKALAAAQSSSHYRVIRQATDNLAWHTMFGKRDATESRRWLEASRGLDGKVPQTTHEKALRLMLESKLASDLDEATARMREASELAESAGLSAEVRARAVEGLALLLIRANDLDGAAAAIETLADRDDPVSTLVLVSYRAHLAGFRGDHAAAAAGFERAAELERDREMTAGFLVSAAGERTDLGEHAAAIALLDRALATAETPEIVRKVACARATALAARDEIDAAIAARRRCLSLGETSKGPLDDTTLAAMRRLAELYVERGEPRLAIDYYERALERHRQKPVSFGLHTTRYALAKLIVRTDRARAIELATAAERGLRPTHPAIADGVAAWLRSARR